MRPALTLPVPSFFECSSQKPVVASAPGLLLVEIYSRAGGELVAPHALARVVGSARRVAAGGSEEGEGTDDVGARHVPAELNRHDIQVGRALTHVRIKAEARRLERRIGERHRGHHPVVGAEHLLVGHINKERHDGMQHLASGLAGIERHDVAVLVPDRVRAVAVVQETRHTFPALPASRSSRPYRRAGSRRSIAPRPARRRASPAPAPYRSRDAWSCVAPYHPTSSSFPIQ